MRNLLITGGAGFIGANFVHYWMDAHPHHRVVVLDALTYAGNRHNLAALELEPRFRFVHGDICDAALLEQVLREEHVDTLVHFAAESHVDRSIHGPEAFVHTNVVGTHCLLTAARKVWQQTPDGFDGKRFHHVSTDEVYGSLTADDPPFSETTPYAPSSPYSASKAASDHLVRAYYHTYGLPVTTSNCSNNYGPYHFPEKLIPLVIVNALNGRPLPVYGDGRNVRDWLYVEDHCRGIELVLEHGRPGETYNVGGNNERPNLEIVETLCRLMDQAFAGDGSLRSRFPDAPAAKGRPTESLVQFVADRPGHDWRYAIDASKISRELGYLPEVSFEDGLTRTLHWFLTNEGWWRGILDGSYRDWISLQYDADAAAGAFSGSHATSTAGA